MPLDLSRRIVVVVVVVVMTVAVICFAACDYFVLFLCLAICCAVSNRF